jgi:hypothetical protein
MRYKRKIIRFICQESLRWRWKRIRIIKKEIALKKEDLKTTFSSKKGETSITTTKKSRS